MATEGAGDGSICICNQPSSARGPASYQTFSTSNIFLSFTQICIVCTENCITYFVCVIALISSSYRKLLIQCEFQGERVSIMPSTPHPFIWHVVSAVILRPGHFLGHWHTSACWPCLHQETPLAHKYMYCTTQPLYYLLI